MDRNAVELFEAYSVEELAQAREQQGGPSLINCIENCFNDSVAKS